MKKYIYIFLALAVIAGCGRIHEPEVPGGDCRMDVSISLQTKAGSLAPVVKSVRVIAFDNSGNCALNSFFGGGFGYELSPVSDGYTVDVTSPLTLTITESRVYDVYVVLNEDGYVLSGTETALSGLLDAIEVGDSKTTFQTYYDSFVKYNVTAATGAEPAFLMSAYQQVTIGDGASTVPQRVEFYTSDTMSGRTMAQITVDKITSGPVDGQEDYSSSDVPKLFVLGVSLVNVPLDNTWTTAPGQLGHNFTEIDFGGENAEGYYDRVWAGSVRQKIGLTARRDDYTDRKLYRTTMENTKTAWSFDASHAAIFFNSKDQKKAYESAVNGTKAIDNKWENKNDNSVKYLMDNVFPGLFIDPNVISETFYSKTATEISSLVFHPGEASDDYWTVSLGNSYYVPENVTDARESATCIKVRLGIASPTLTLPDVPDTTFINMLPNPTVLLTATDSTYCISDYDLLQNNFKVPEYKNGKLVYDKDGRLKYITMKDWVQSTFQGNSHIVNALDESIEYPIENATDDQKKVNNYKVYVDGFSKRTEGTGEVYLSNALTDGQGGSLSSVEWNIDTENYFELTIPVNSRQFGGDYSVRRNTRYTITLHVDQSTYGKLTRSSMDSGTFGIKATVKTEIINDNED